MSFVGCDDDRTNEIDIGVERDSSHDSGQKQTTDIYPDTDSLEDTDTNSPEDTDTSDKLPQPPPWLKGQQNKCAPADEIRVPPERIRRPSLPEPLGETPRQEWVAAASCAPRGEFSDTTYALGHFTVDGDKRALVVAGIQAHSAVTLSDELIALAFVDAQTGETLRCHEFEEPLQTPDPKLVVSSELERYWLYTETIRDAHDMVDEPDYLLRSGTLDGEFFTQRILDPGSPTIRPNMITPNGQWLLGFDTKYLVSFDALSGEVLWAKHVRELWEGGGEDIEIFNAFHTGDSNIIVSLITGTSSYALLAVDECGNTEEPFIQGNGRAARVQKASGFHIVDVRRDGKNYVEVFKNGTVVHAQECYGSMLYSKNRHVCFDRDGENMALASFELDGEDGKVAVLPSLADYHYGRYSPGALAARNGSVLVQRNTRTSGDPNSAQSLMMMVDPLSGDTLASVTSPTPRSSVSAPLLTSSGMMIFIADGDLYGYQTDIPGLATTPHPRGLGVGGNENRGRVEPPIESAP
jgi:hypothetical protein